MTIKASIFTFIFKIKNFTDDTISRDKLRIRTFPDDAWAIKRYRTAFFHFPAIAT
jgi:hypothetical protein